MHPVMLQIGALTIYSWGVMVALGFSAGIALGIFLGIRSGIKYDDLIDIALFTLLSSLFGARLFYVIGFWDSFKSNPLSTLYLWEGGMVFYGGLIFAIIAIAILSKRKNIPLLRILDLASPASAIGYAIGRIGCLLRGCCYGNECSYPWAMHFPDISGLRHPTQLYSSLAGIIILFVLF